MSKEVINPIPSQSSQIEISAGVPQNSKTLEGDDIGAYVTNSDEASQNKNLPSNNKKIHSDSKFIQYQRTKLHEVVNKSWGVSWIDNDIFSHVIKYANPESAKSNKNGFSLKSLDGKNIEWSPAGQQGPEKISAKKITEESAAAIVTLARARGWKSINLSGSVKEKEMLWLAAQRQNLRDKEDFKKRQEAGDIPKTNKDGSPNLYKELEVANFMPLADSKIMQQWQKELAAYNSANPEAIAPPKGPSPKEIESKKPILNTDNEKTAAIEKKSSVIKKEAVTPPSEVTDLALYSHPQLPSDVKGLEVSKQSIERLKVTITLDELKETMAKAFKAGQKHSSKNNSNYTGDIIEAEVVKDSNNDIKSLPSPQKALPAPQKALPAPSNGH